MFKIWNNLTISYILKYQSTHLGSPQSLDMVSSLSMVSWVCRANFMDEWEKPLRIWTVTGLVVTGTALSDVRKPGLWWMQDADVVWNDEKLVSGYWILVLDKVEEDRMTDELGYIIDECGRFSISSWLVDVALSPKTENHLKSPKFRRFSI